VPEELDLGKFSYTRLIAELEAGLKRQPNTAHLSWDTSGDNDDFGTFQGVVQLVSGVTMNLHIIKPATRI